MPFVPSSFLLLVVRPGATRSILAPSSDGLMNVDDMDREQHFLFVPSNTPGLFAHTRVVGGVYIGSM